MPRIIFFDVDGTLIAMGRHTMTERVKETLLKLQSRGTLLCVATGRPYVVVPHFEGIKFDAFLTFNGSYCRTGEEIIFRNPLDAEDVMRVLANAEGLGRSVALATEDRIEANGMDHDLVEYFTQANQTIRLAEDFETLSRESVYQMMLACTPAEYPLLAKGTRNAALTSWSPKAADVIPANGGKGVGVEKILAYYGIGRSDAMAFGDGLNDVEMLHAVGTGIAMGNAIEAVRQQADAVCPSVEEDGIYQYCRAHGLI